MGNVFKIRNKESGLFLASQRSWNEWNHNGRIYTRINHVTSSIRSRISSLGDCEIVEFKLIEVGIKEIKPPC